ncbi:Trafficking kinesin-binding protein milt [Amphibalanus amphitrite]|uniref:Trafficking kinesin-binding protein milt n=2 Tax=Amphibalanus amphitrite TaxID=1232801 RepID=A0A6A4VRW1_AMPAM|nr:Trafficking kinesin-binding protein milt [Amphibalanus amphitrite]
MDIPSGRGRRPRSQPSRKEVIQRALRNLEVSELRDDVPDGRPSLPAELSASGEEMWRALLRRPTSLLDLSWNVLCGSRVSQMTKAYNDIDAVTRLLEEKEKDLELAAKIGQQLLERNKQVEERLTVLEGELQTANDTITQLKHDLQLKTELLHIYNNDFDESGSEAGTPSGMRHAGLEMLQARTSQLEKENSELRTELQQLSDSTETAEGREKALVDDVVFELTDANQTIRSLSDELASRVDEHMRNQEEVTCLLAQLVDSQSRAKRLSQENDELQSFVSASKEAQSELALELADLKDKYAELQAMYHDAQQLIRRREKKSASQRSSYLGGVGGQPDSLASELEFSLSSLGSNDSGVSPALGISPFGAPPSRSTHSTATVVSAAPYRSAFDTVRCARAVAPIPAAGDGSAAGGGVASLTQSTGLVSASAPASVRVSSRVWGAGAGAGTASAGAVGTGAAAGGGDSGAWMQDGASVTSDSECSIEMDDCSELEYPGISRGIPGVPGSPDLRAALHRLGPGSKLGSDGMRTPESIMSLGSSRGSLGGSLGSMGSSSGSGWKLPEKLQIVKPMEGSLTLHHWSRLATPHLGGLLDARPGVSSRGERSLAELSSGDEGDGTSSDEEDPAVSYKAPTLTGGLTFTLTNCTVLHPDDTTQLTSSLQGGQMSTLPVSLSSSASAPPCSSTLSRRASAASTYTFSTHLGLARALHERGLTPSVAGSPPPSGLSTPANSPETSRPGSPAPGAPAGSPPQPALFKGQQRGLMDVGKTLSLGAELIRRTFSPGDTPRAPSYSRNQEPQREEAPADGSPAARSPLNRRVRHQMSLMERLQRIGLQGILGADGQPVSAARSRAGVGIGAAGGAITRGQLGAPGRPGSGALKGRLALLGTVQQSGRGRAGRAAAAGRGRARHLEDCVGTVGVLAAGRKGGFL